GEGVSLPCVLTLRDEAGRELLRHRMEERVLNLPTRGLMPGLYLATVESPQGSTTQRLVVK
ncbi:MAG: T9SS type A sorting domain-containing protein, partial [Bacteroidales bacterium]|nr:T9SS type A sorting domain-containing protein [Bacteroidales bacterium]